jgi:hypothetical protein
LIPFALVGLALVPILIWNMSNDWITLDHTVKKASTAGKEWLITWRYLAPSVGQQLGLMSPLIALGVAISIGCLIRDCWRRGTGPTNLDQDRAAFLLSVSAPILVFYGLLAFHRTVEANWLAPAYVTLVPAAAFYWLRPLTRVQQWSLAAAIGLGLLLQAPLAMGDALYTSGIPEGLARVGAPFKPALDVTNRVRGWKELGAIAAREKAKWEKETGRPVFLFVDHYSLAALVGFYAKAPDHVFAIPCPVPQNQFDVWALAGRRPPEGAVGICVYDLAKAGRLADPFFRTSHLDYSPGEYKRGDTVIRTYLFRVMFDYQGNDRWLDLARQVSPPSYK